MTNTIERRLLRLEARDAPPLRQRYVWLSSPDDPVPEPQPGEQIALVHWIWADPAVQLRHVGMHTFTGNSRTAFTSARRVGAAA
jgi:hypothetical protein